MPPRRKHTTPPRSVTLISGMFMWVLMVVLGYWFFVVLALLTGMELPVPGNSTFWVAHILAANSAFLVVKATKDIAKQRGWRK